MSDRLLEELSEVDSQEFGEILETPREQGRLNNTLNNTKNKYSLNKLR